jgi:hypothetical protein
MPEQERLPLSEGIERSGGVNAPPKSAKPAPPPPQRPTARVPSSIINGKDLHGEARAEVFKLFTDFGDQVLTLPWDMLPEARRLLRELTAMSPGGARRRARKAKSPDVVDGRQLFLRMDDDDLVPQDRGK